MGHTRWSCRPVQPIGHADPLLAALDARQQFDIAGAERRRSGVAFEAFASHIPDTMQPDLSPEDYAAIAALLRDTIAADRFPLSPRVQAWRAILHKLDPPKARPALPPPKPAGTPSMLLAKKRGRRR
jgi:hypothetical protein